jgi:hypothetical protein
MPTFPPIFHHQNLKVKKKKKEVEEVEESHAIKQYLSPILQQQQEEKEYNKT